MTTAQIVKLTIDWRNAVTDLPPEIQERQTQNLYNALRQMPEVEQVNRISDSDAPDGGMGAAWLKDLLLTEVVPGSLSSVFNAIRQRLPGTPINFEVEVDNQKKRIRVEGVRPEDFDAALDKLTKAVKELSNE
jgi:hypothetical protein